VASMVRISNRFYTAVAVRENMMRWRKTAKNGGQRVGRVV